MKKINFIKKFPVIIICYMTISDLGCLCLARDVFLNGTDVSSARNQRLEKVDIRIDENGNIFIDAPHYQVNQESTFMPLSSWIQGVNSPAHKKPTDLKSAEMGKVTNPDDTNAPKEAALNSQSPAAKELNQDPIVTGETTPPAEQKTTIEKPGAKTK